MTNYVNQAIRFNYAGGSQPNSERTAFITLNYDDSGNMCGWCFDRNEYRQFKPNLMSNIRTLETRVTPYELLPNDTAAICELFEDDGWQVYDDSENSRIVCYKPEKLRIKVSGGVMYLTGPRGCVSLNAIRGKVRMETFDANNNSVSVQQDASARAVIDAVAAVE